MMAASSGLDQAAFELWQHTKGHDVPDVVNPKVIGQAGRTNPAIANVLKGLPPDHMSKDLVPLVTQSDDAQGAAAFMRQKVSLGLPNDRDVSWAEAFAALAKATGLTVVTEDYLDHKFSSPQTVRLAPGGGVMRVSNVIVGQGDDCGIGSEAYRRRRHIDGFASGSRGGKYTRCGAGEARAAPGG